jgi:hypothetical protein
MKRRLGLCALLLLVAIPAFAQRRRAVNPGVGRCQYGTIVSDAYASLMEVDGQHVYWIDDLGGAILRSPIATDDPEVLGFLSDDFPLSMTMDDTYVYIGTLPFEAFQGGTAPGSIVRIAKGGGAAPETIVSGVNTPWDLETDATHVYWVATGTLDFENETILPDGKVERATKDGVTRQTLAENLSGPLDLAIDATHVFYSETGLAEGDPTVGLYRIAKSGGSVTTLDDKSLVLGLDVADDFVVFWGGADEASVGLLRVPKNGSAAPSLLVDDITIWSPPRVMDGRAYYLTADEEEGLDRLQSVGIVNPQQPVTHYEGLITSPDFELDACSAFLGNVDAESIVRVPR